jgi:hypothetical protein
MEILKINFALLMPIILILKNMVSAIIEEGGDLLLAKLQAE